MVRAVGARLPCIGTPSHLCNSSRRSCVGAQVAGRRDASSERSPGCAVGHARTAVARHGECDK
eukprot:scaffold78672_cov59-Phaeocystis_antarctica.AAC.1